MRKRMIGVAVLAAVAVACGGGAEETEQGATPPAAGAQEVAVTAIDYAFEGVPETLEAGETTFVMQNDGEVRHELSFGKLLGDLSIEEVVQLPESQLGQEIERMREGIRPIEAGATGEVTIDLEPGRYGYVCFVAEGTGRPHAFEGMVGEFTVE